MYLLNIFKNKNLCLPTAAYQVLHLLPELWYRPGRGTPQSGLTGAGGVPEVGYRPAGVPQPGLTGGLPEMGYPPGRGTPLARFDEGTQAARVPPQ